MFNERKDELGFLDMNANKLKVVAEGIPIADVRMVSIDDTIHIIDSETPDHYIFNVESSAVIHYTPEQTQILWVDQAIIFKSEKSILTLNDDKMYKYSMNQRKWVSTCNDSGLYNFSFAASIVLAF